MAGMHYNEINVNGYLGVRYILSICYSGFRYSEVLLVEHFCCVQGDVV